MRIPRTIREIREMVSEPSTRGSVVSLSIVRSHLFEYISEFVETAALLFFLVPFEALLFGLTSPVALHVPSVFRLFTAGIGCGIVSWLISLTAFGRLSGAHMNPAVSIGFCLIGKMRAVDASGY